MTVTATKPSQPQPIPGIADPDVADRLRAIAAKAGHSVNDILARDKTQALQVLLRYDRGDGAVTPWLPSKRHLDYVAKGWTAVDVQLP